MSERDVDMAGKYHIMKNSSALYRLGQMYFNERLAPYNLGAGQQFFLSRIARMPGVSMAELAQIGTFDNGTVTRAVRRLCDEGYIRVETDETDRRVRRLYLTEKGEPLIEPLADMRHEWFEAVTSGFSDDEKAQTGALLERLADNARSYVMAMQNKGEKPEKVRYEEE